MERIKTSEQSGPERLLHAKLKEFLDKHGEDKLLDELRALWTGKSQEEIEEIRSLGRIGLYMQAHVYGPNGWNFLNIEEVLDEEDIESVNDYLESPTQDVISLRFYAPKDFVQERFLITDGKTIRQTYDGFDSFNTLEEHQVADLIRYVEGLWIYE